MNKKAALGAQTMIFVFIIILVIIGAGIVIGVGIFFAGEYDFREADAITLKNQIAYCITNSNINLESKESFGAEFYKTCRINKQAIDTSFLIYIEVDEKPFLQAGSLDRTQCALSEKNNAYPKCISETFDKGGKKIFVQAGSNQNSRKIRI
ncbi:hypothetical protein J4233_01800 [Candidatus Pacearchaeota archaeon]|nr:hypothetical protein [Candidatus Pacearchaeota archaeon]